MKSFLIILVCVLFYNCDVMGQLNKLLKNSFDFFLLDSKKNTDFNYNLIKRINETGANVKFKMDSTFGFIKKGKYSVYRYIKKVKNEFKDDYSLPDSITHLIVLKVNKNNTIIDGYYYRLEWAEMPMDAILHRISSKIEYKDVIRIIKLNMKIVNKQFTSSEIFSGSLRISS